MNTKPNDDEKKWIAALAVADDRSLILLISSMLEFALTRRIGAALDKELSEAVRERLFAYTGAFGTFSNCIDAAKALGLIDQDDFVLMREVRRQRNSAAHKVDFTIDLAVSKRFAYLNNKDGGLTEVVSGVFDSLYIESSNMKAAVEYLGLPKEARDQFISMGAVVQRNLSGDRKTVVVGSVVFVILLRVETEQS